MSEENKTLNKGLEALLGQSNSNQRSVKDIEVSKIKPGRFQPRSNFDKDKLAELTESIKKQGVLSPILVRELGLNGFEVIAGERRLRSSKMAGLETIPCLVDQKKDEDALISALIENLQREDLNPVEEAKGFDRLKREFGLTQDEVASSTGKARSTIANSLRILSLPTLVLDMLSSGKIEYLSTGSQGEPMGAMMRIAKFTHPDVIIEKGDAVVFSSKIIPGNEKKLYKLHNQLVKEGLEVISEENEFVHVSGHPNREDLKEMYGWIRPKCIIPVHGEHRHMIEHINFAKEMQVPNSVLVENGDIVKLYPGSKPEVYDRAPSGKLYVDGNISVEEDAQSIKELSLIHI